VTAGLTMRAHPSSNCFLLFTLPTRPQPRLPAKSFGLAELARRRQSSRQHLPKILEAVGSSQPTIGVMSRMVFTSGVESWGGVPQEGANLCARLGGAMSPSQIARFDLHWQRVNNEHSGPLGNRSGMGTRPTGSRTPVSVVGSDAGRVHRILPMRASRQ
jgi:hypothetical protein